MGWRGGYAGEYKAKKELIDIFGELGVIKVAISQFGADFICVVDGLVAKAVEVKETTKKKYYPSPKEKKQFERIKEFANIHNCEAELWIYYRRGTGQTMEKEVRNLLA